MAYIAFAFELGCPEIKGILYNWRDPLAVIRDDPFQGLFFQLAQAEPLICAYKV